MRNYITIQNDKRKRYLSLGILSTLLFAIIGMCSLLLLFPEYTEADDFLPITATVTGIEEVDDGFYITTEEYSLPLWISDIHTKCVDVEALKAIPQGAVVDALAAKFDIDANTIDIYIGALSYGGRDVLKLDDAIRLQKQNVMIGSIVCLSITGILLGCAIAGWILFAKNAKEKNVDIFSVLARGAVGPQAVERKRLVIGTVIFSILACILVATFGILSDTVDERFSLGVIITGGILALGIILIITVFNPLVKRREIQLYDNLFSFDKEVLPPVSFDVSYDHANGRTFVFTQTGIVPLSEQDEEAFLENHFKATMQEKFPGDTAFGEYSEVPSIPQYLDTTNLVPYSELHFKALAFFANAPTRITVIITAETEKFFPLSAHDICFILDGDMYCSLDKYKVEVEGLDEIIQRRRELMLKAKSPIPKLYR